MEEICEEIQETEEKQAADKDHAESAEAPCIDILGDNPDHNSESEISNDDRDKIRVAEKRLSAFNKFLCCRKQCSDDMKEAEERQTFFRQVRRELQNDVKNARLAPQKQLTCSSTTMITNKAISQ